MKEVKDIESFLEQVSSEPWGERLVELLRSNSYKSILVEEVKGKCKSCVIIMNDEFDLQDSRIGYVRVSTENQAERGYGINVQVDEIIKFAAERYYILSAICFDLGLSGDNHKELFTNLKNKVPASEYFSNIRPALHFALNHLNSHNKLLAYNPSRLWRENDVTGGQIRFAVMSADSDIELVEEPKVTLWETDTSRYFANNMLFNIADYDRRNLVSRMRAGRANKAKAGKCVNSKVLYGYRTDNDGTIRIYEPEAEKVRFMYQLKSMGFTQKEIAEQMNLDESKTKRWTSAMVNNILCALNEEKYRFGMRTWNGRKTYHPELIILKEEI